MFYDAPTPPPGIFDEFLAIPNLKADIETRGMASLFLAGNNSDFMRGHRAMFGTVSVRDWTPALIQAVINETEVRGSTMPNLGVLGLTIDWDPVLERAARTQECRIHLL